MLVNLVGSHACSTLGGQPSEHCGLAARPGAQVEPAGVLSPVNGGLRRLVGRGTEGPEELERRLATARVEMEAAAEFDHVVINDDVDRAVSELAGLIGLE